MTTEEPTNHRSEHIVSRSETTVSRSALSLPIRHVARPGRHTNTNYAFTEDDPSSISGNMEYCTLSETSADNSSQCNGEYSRRELLKRITSFASRSSGGITASLNRCYNKCSFLPNQVSLF